LIKFIITVVNIISGQRENIESSTIGVLDNIN